MKVIFLDIDGVLITPRSEVANRTSSVVRPVNSFDPDGAVLLYGICSDLKVKIVISSVWRMGSSNFEHEDHTHIRNQFNIYGLTPFLHPDWKTPLHEHVNGDGPLRGSEIKDWLSKHPDVTKYMILDDDTDMLDEQKPFFIRTDFKNGISFDDYVKMKEYFKD